MTSTAAQIGYCTNVHAGTDVATIREKLEQFAAPIAADRLAHQPDAGPLGVGLWIPASAADQLNPDDAAEQFARWLGEHHLFPLTINGFPYDNFHRPVVKHRVYQPAWWEEQRLQYTVGLARLMHRLLPVDDTVGSISTLPLGWPGPLGSAAGADVAGGGEGAAESIDPEQRSRGRVDWAERDRANTAQAGKNLRTLADQLQRLEQETGRRIVVAIEPEPGCLLDRCGDVVEFFEKELPDANHRRYLTVCHDVCHAAVMFESQSDAMHAYARAGITIGKVQVSSAIDVPLGKYSPAHRSAAMAELTAFAEDRYLHQTGVRDATGQFRLVEDLPQWLASPLAQRIAAAPDDPPLNDHHLRIHFHVPIYRPTLGTLLTTQQEISQCVLAICGPDAPEFTGHYEVETYAWTVLPESVAEDAPSGGRERAEPSGAPASVSPLTGLAAGIAEELRWFESLLATQSQGH